MFMPIKVKSALLRQNYWTVHMYDAHYTLIYLFYLCSGFPTHLLGELFAEHLEHILLIDYKDELLNGTWILGMESDDLLEQDFSGHAVRVAKISHTE